MGFASGESTHPSARDVLRPNCSIVGVFTGAYDRAALDTVFAHLGDLVQRGEVGAGSSTARASTTSRPPSNGWPSAT